jgi:sugar phosphate isomerase/epimerase
VGIEGAFNHVCYTPEVLSEVIEEIGRDNVRVIFDLYNYLDISNYTDAYAILERGHRLFGDGILLYHLKDFTVEDGAIRQCGVGRGILDYEKLLGEIYRYNRNAVLVLEGTVGDDIPIAVKHIKDIIARLK